MSKRQYEAIAGMLRQHVTGATSDEERRVASAIAGNLAGFFQGDNPRFDSDRFLVACGMLDPTDEDGHRHVPGGSCPICDAAEFDEPPFDERTCSICDAVGHGYPGAGPCPLEDRGYGYDDPRETI